MLFAGMLLAGCGGAQDEPAGNIESDTPNPETTATSAGSASACARPDFAAETPDGISTEALPVRDLTISRASGGEVSLEVEVADEPDEMSQGLMFRESLGEGCGMIFAYPDERRLSFWMRNTLIPLSIAYANSEGEIVDLQDMEALDDEPPSYVSAEPAQYAVEANVGFFEENGVAVGDTISLSPE